MAFVEIVIGENITEGGRENHVERVEYILYTERVDGSGKGR
jgi:hypothetical protein